MRYNKSIRSETREAWNKNGMDAGGVLFFLVARAVCACIYVMVLLLLLCKLVVTTIAAIRFFFHLYQHTDPSRRGRVGWRAPDSSTKWLTRRPWREEWRVVDQMEWRAQYASSRNRGSPPERKLTELPCGSKGCFHTFGCTLLTSAFREAQLPPSALCS